MLKNLSGTVLVAAGECPAEITDEHTVRYAVLKGHSVVRRGECRWSELPRQRGWDMRASFFSRAGYFERTQAQTANKRLATVVARRFIDGEMLFNEPYRLRLAVHPINEQEVSLQLMAAGEIDCLRLQEALPLETHPVSTATLEEAAIAALIAKVSREPVQVAYARGERFLSFVAERGEVSSRRVENISPGDIDAMASAAQRSELARSGGYTGGEGTEISLKVYLGEARPLASQGAAARDFQSRDVEKAMAALIENGDALAEPELYGMRHVASAWNFLEDAQIFRARAYQAAMPVSLAAIAASLLLVLMVLVDMTQASSVARDVDQARQQVLAEREQLNRRVPDQKELARFKEFSELLAQRGDQVRADRLLSWLTAELPEGVTVASLQLFPEGEEPPELVQAKGETKGVDMLSRFFPGGEQKENAGSKAAANPRQAAAKGSYTLRLDLTLAGGYEAVESQAAEVIRRLSPRLGFTRSHLAYDATKQRAHLVSELSAQAGSFR